MSSPPAVPARSSRPSQPLLAGLVLLALGALIWRAYAPRLDGRPVEEAARTPKSVDLNRASKSELMQLPGVGPNLADAIVQRRAGRRFESVEDLHAVQGIGPKTVDLLRSHVAVEPAADVETQLERLERTAVNPPADRGGKLQPGDAALDVNAATAAELQRLPRIGPVLAAAIVQAREQKRFASVDDLRRVRGIGGKTLDGLRPLVRVGP